MGLHCPVEVGSPSSRAGSTLKAYPRAGTPSWPLRTYGHVHEKQGKCVPHDVGENVCVLRRQLRVRPPGIGCILGRAFLGGCVGSRGSRPTWRLRVVFCAIASPFGEIVPPNSPFRPSTAAPVAGVVLVPDQHETECQGSGVAPGGRSWGCYLGEG